MNFKSITLLGQSGVGKTTISDLLAREGWYHYSGDYRIATYYLKDTIQKWLEALVKEVPELLILHQKNALDISGKVTIDNLALLSQFINKIGKQGIPLSLFEKRQQLFKKAEKKAMYDVSQFKLLAYSTLGKTHFINDAGGSLLEYLDDKDLINYLANETLFVYIDADSDLQDELMKRAVQYPKPICYDSIFLKEMISKYQHEKNNVEPDQFESDEFLRFVCPKLLVHRRQKALELVSQHGIKIDAKQVWSVKNSDEFIELINIAYQEQRR